MKNDVISNIGPIAECLKGLKTIDLFIDSTLLGLRHASEATGWIEVAKRVEKLRSGSIRDEDRRFEKAKLLSQDLEEFAKQENTDGHPYLYGISIVRVWTILETLADDLMLLRLVERKYKVDSDVFSNVKLPLREILGVSPESQAEAVLNELKQVTRARLQQGVGRFEALLSAISLGGAIDEDIRKAIFECGQVRNLIVHRNAIVDSKFMSACPWFAVAQGDRLPLSRKFFQLYFNAVFWYAMELQFRIFAFDGSPSDPELIRIQNLFLRNVKTFNALKSSNSIEATNLPPKAEQ
jgi:hypothetical protein